MTRTTGRLAVLFLAFAIALSGASVVQGVAAQETANETTTDGSADGTALQIAALTAPESATPGSTVSVAAQIQNPTDQPITETVEYRFAGIVVDRELVSVSPGGTAVVQFDVNTGALEPGAYFHGVFTAENGQVEQITLSESFTLESVDAPETAAVGDEVTVDATVSNPNAFETNQSVDFRLQGQLVAQERVSVGANESANVSFTVPTEGIPPGDYVHGVFTRDDGQFLQITLEEAVEETPTEEPVNETETPTEVPVNETETPTEVPVNETETPTDIPLNATETPTEEPVNETDTPTEVPVNETETPTEAPVNETETPVEEPVNETETPTDIPLNVTETPTEEPVNETDTPTEAPVNETETPTEGPDDNVTETPTEAEPSASVVFPTYNATSVTVDRVTLSDGGFVAIHNQTTGGVGPVVGVSEYLDAGTHENVEVRLFDVPGAEFEETALTENQTLYAMPHQDTDDDREFDFLTSNGTDDGPYTQDGEAVTDELFVVIEAAEEPVTETPTEEPAEETESPTEVPVNETETPTEETETVVVLTETETEQPANETDGEAPVDDNLTDTPTEEPVAETETPGNETETETVVVLTDTETPGAEPGDDNVTETAEPVNETETATEVPVNETETPVAEPDDNVTETPSAEQNASVDFVGMESNGTAVTVDSVTVPDGGFVAIHNESLVENETADSVDGDAVGSVIGVSEYLEPGTHENVTVRLFDVCSTEFEETELTENQTLYAMPHQDTNDNRTFDFVATNGTEDGPYTIDGEPVVDAGFVTVEGIEEPVTETPAAEPGDDNVTETPTEEPVNETETPTDIPLNATETPTEEPVEETDTPTEVPVNETETPVAEPGDDNDTETEEAVAETETPDPFTETEAPSDETETPVGDVETESPAEGTTTPVDETNDTADETVTVTADAAVEFENQTAVETANGTAVTVDSVTVPQGGFVTIHNESLLEGDALGSVVGVSEHLQAGTYEDLSVVLYNVSGVEFTETELTENQTLIAMPHQDTNDNQVYDFVASNGTEDGPYTADGEAVVDEAVVAPADSNVTMADGDADAANETDAEPANETETVTETGLLGA